MLTGKIPAKRAPKLSPSRRKKLLVPRDGGGPIDHDVARKIGQLLLNKSGPLADPDSEASGEDLAEETAPKQKPGNS